MFFKRVIGCILLGSICGSVYAEGSFLVGLNQPLSDFTASTYPQKVDIISAAEVINISLCGAADTDSVSVEILDPDGVSVYGPVTRMSGNVSCSDPFTASQTPTNPISYSTNRTGSFTVRLENDIGFAINRFDTNYVWNLDLNNFSGNLYTLVANDLGINAPYSGYSIPTSKGRVIARHPQYQSYPAIVDPGPDESPVLTGGFTFIDDAETSGGTQDGLTIFMANSDGSTVDTRVYWDDETYLTGISILPENISGVILPAAVSVIWLT